MYDVIIVGGGPAGLTAGIYAARSGLRSLLLRSSFKPSLITTTDLIENFPGFPEGIGGLELVDRFTAQALRFGLEIKDDDVTSMSRTDEGGVATWLLKTASAEYTCLAVIVSTGTEYARLGVPGETEFTGRGVSYCATCDGPFYRDAHLAVVGGGDTAIQEALYLTNFARKVTVIHRRDRLRATAVLQERALANPKITFEWNAVVEEILGDTQVHSIRIKSTLDPSQVKTMDVDGVFIFTGMIPNTRIFQGLLAMDQRGYITVDSQMKTSIDGVFACGDCTSKLLRQVVTACGDGATAAFAAYEYISGIKKTAYKAFTS